MRSAEEDLRVLKTKRAVFETLEQLLQEKRLDKITVTELANRALINKGTFYLHYTDIYDLYRDALKAHMAAIAQKVDFMSLFLSDPDLFSEKLIELSLNRTVFNKDAFLSERNASYNQNAMLLFTNALAEAMLLSNSIPDTEENKLKLRFLFSGAGSLLRKDTPSDEACIAKIISNTIRNLFASYCNADP